MTSPVLPELVTEDLTQYEALAFDLATKPERLAAIRDRLAANRDRCALFDADRFRRHIEAAYVTMWRRWVDGQPPASFDDRSGNGQRGEPP